MIITYALFFLTITTVILHTLIGVVTLPLQGALVIDATGHSVLFGIAVAFLCFKNLTSSALFIGALLSVFMMHGISLFLTGPKILEKGSALGIAFSSLFAAGILLITLYARNIHLDLDMVLVGNIEYAVYEGLHFYSIDCGPKMAWIQVVLIFVLALGLFFFWKQITALLFDGSYAYLTGYYPWAIQVGIIILTSYALVVSFNVVGAIILVGIAAAPIGMWWGDVSSYKSLIFFSLISMIALAIVGVSLALYLDLPIAATITFSITTYTIIHIFFFHRKSICTVFSEKKILRAELIREFIYKKYGTYQIASESIICVAKELPVDIQDVKISVTRKQ